MWVACCGVWCCSIGGAAAAEYSGVSCTEQDIQLYLARLARSAPLAARAGGMSAAELADQFARLRREKGGDTADEA